VENLGKTPFTIKEGAEYRMRVKFRVQHEVISGLRYLQLVKRHKITADKSQQMMVGFPTRIKAILTKHQGSYGPNTTENPFYTRTCTSTSPSMCLVLD
jgi:Rho GDP-dissociation inhibitor